MHKALTLLRAYKQTRGSTQQDPEHTKSGVYSTRLANKETFDRMQSPTHPRKSPLNSVARGATTAFGADHAALRKTVHSAPVAKEAVTKGYERVAEFAVGPARPALAETWR